MYLFHWPEFLLGTVAGVMLAALIHCIRLTAWPTVESWPERGQKEEDEGPWSGDTWKSR